MRKEEWLYCIEGILETAVKEESDFRWWLKSHCSYPLGSSSISSYLLFAQNFTEGLSSLLASSCYESSSIKSSRQPLRHGELEVLAMTWLTVTWDYSQISTPGRQNHLLTRSSLGLFNSRGHRFSGIRLSPWFLSALPRIFFFSQMTLVHQLPY